MKSDTIEIDELKKIEEMEESENKLFRDALQKIATESNITRSKETISTLVCNLEKLYAFDEPDDNNTPRFILKKLLLHIKGTVEQYVKAKAPDKEKCAGMILEHISIATTSFFKDKIIPGNIYDIVVENNLLHNNEKSLKDEIVKLKKEIEEFRITQQPSQQK